MDQFIFTETLIVELLVIVSIVAIVVRRLRVPYTVALVISGLIISLEQPPRIALTPELILALFVPPLVFEAAFHLEWSHLRQNLGPILTLAVPGVVLTTAVIGLIVSLGTGITLVSALVFGALISATDPVAVVALFRSLGMPSRLVTMVEGESLLNDGTAIVVFNIMVAAAVSEMTGNRPQVADEASHILTGLGVFVEFLRVSLGGVAIGIGFGLCVSWLISRIDDSLIETTLTTVLAFGAYLVAESLQISGVLAVVSAGIICGNVGLSGMSPTTRLVLRNFWEYVAFITNSLVFLLIGLEVNLYQLVQYGLSIGLAIVAVVVSRAVVIYGFSALLKLFWPHKRPGVSAAYQHVLFWGGLRGAVGLALVGRSASSASN